MARFHQARCAKCRYDLTGLARAGYCPECGRRYDVDVPATVYDPDDPQRRTERLLRRLRLAALIVGMVMVAACTGMCAFVVPDPRMVVSVGVVIFICLGLGLIIMLLPRRDED